MESLRPSAPLNRTSLIDPWLGQRARLVLVFLPIVCIVIGVFNFLTQFGLIFDVTELMQAPNSNGGLHVHMLAGICLASLLVWNLFIYRHYLLLLAVAKTFRAAILRRLDNLIPRSPSLCFTPRTAHGSRDPPSAG